MEYHFGVNAEPFYKQLGVPKKSVEHLQIIFNGVWGAMFRDLLPESGYKAFLKRLGKELDAVLIMKEKGTLC